MRRLGSRNRFIMLIGAALMGATALSTIVIKKKEER